MTDEEMGPISWVFDKSDILDLIRDISTATEVIFDLETTGLDDHAVRGGRTNNGIPARIVMATFTLPQPDLEEGEDALTYVLPLDHPWSPFMGKWRDILRWVMRVVRKKRKPVIGHNVKFDARWTYTHTGVDLVPLIAWDTQISSHMIDENRSTRLKTRAADTFSVEEWDDFDLTKPGAAMFVDFWVLGDYAARDTYWTWRLYILHRASLVDEWEDNWPLSPDEVEDARLGTLALNVGMPTVASLTRIENNGIGLDIEWARAELASHVDPAEEAMEWLVDTYDMDPAKATTAATANWFKELTTKAVEEGDLRVASLTDSGNPQWNKSVLKRQARTGSMTAQAILDHRDHTKKIEFLTSWLDHVAPDGRIHSSYRAGYVVTGRLSSASPNMQQVTKSLKPAFIPRPGFVIIDLDYSQIELRVAAFISRCEPMLQAYRDGKDLHTMMAARITGKPESEVEPDERQGGKSGNFGLIYGMMAPGYREYAEDVYDVHLTLEEAEDVRDAFFDLWEGIADWHERVKDQAGNEGQITSPIGRVRRVPGIFADDWGLRSYSERAAINSPVQGMASDLMQISAASIQGLLPGHKPVRGAMVVGTVHDSIVVEAPLDRWQEVAAECQERMTVAAVEHIKQMGATLDIPLVADAVAGTRWGLGDIR